MASYVLDQVNMQRAILRVYNPTDPSKASFVDIPVVVQISFRDPKQRDENGQTNGQEYIHLIDNSDDNGRTFKPKRVFAATGTPDAVVLDPGTYLDVERPYSFPMVDPKPRGNPPVNGQVYWWICGNDDPWPAAPGDLDSPPLSQYRHVVRFTADNTVDGEPWIEAELIDVLPIRDPKAVPPGQEYVYLLRWYNPPLGPPIPDNDSPYNATFAFTDKTLDRLPDRDGDKPLVRTDPFMQIVNLKWGGPFLAISYETSYQGGGDTTLQSAKFTAAAAPSASPPLPAYDDTYSLFTFSPMLVVAASGTVQYSAIVNASMRKNLSLWTIPGPYTAVDPVTPNATMYYIEWTTGGSSSTIERTNFSGTSAQHSAFVANLAASLVSAGGGITIDKEIQIGPYLVNFPNVTTGTITDGFPIIVTSPGHGTLRTTILVNLSRYIPKGLAAGKSAVFKFKIAIPPLMEQKNDWAELWSYEFTLGDNPNAVQVVSSSGFWTPAEHLAYIDALFAFGSTDGRHDPQLITDEQNSFYPQTTASWKLTASTFGSRNSFPIDDQGIPKWDPASAASTVTLSATAAVIPVSFSVDLTADGFIVEDPPPAPRQINIEVEYPSLKVTMA